MIKIAFLAFILMIVQTFFAILQIKAYQKELKSLVGKGILGIGQKKGFLSQGEILILCYDRNKDKVITCRSMKGITVFNRFKEKKNIAGLSLDEVKKIAKDEDDIINKKLRQKVPYDEKVPDKRKCALLQAVEAVNLRLQREGNGEEAKSA